VPTGDAPFDPHALRVWWYFLAMWVLFWCTAGGVVCRKFGRPVVKGVLLGAILAPIGILLAVLSDES
jgi:hypothetical protein